MRHRLEQRTHTWVSITDLGCKPATSGEVEFWFELEARQARLTALELVVKAARKYANKCSDCGGMELIEAFDALDAQGGAGKE